MGFHLLLAYGLNRLVVTQPLKTSRKRVRERTKSRALDKLQLTGRSLGPELAKVVQADLPQLKVPWKLRVFIKYCYQL